MFRFLACVILLSYRVLAWAFDRESLSMGPWEPVGSPQPPLLDGPDRSSIEELARGAGPVVRAGDLVQVRAHLRTPATAWLWTGREPEARDFASLSSWGDLGSPHLRRALVGRPVGSRLRFTPDITRTAQLPLRGFRSVPHSTLVDNGTLVRPRSWPDIELGNRGTWLDQNATGVELEILQTCAATLFRRSAILRQSGPVLTLGYGMSYAWKREGMLRWSALQAKCSQLRFEIGPLYYRERREPGMLFNWGDSYRRLRPAKDFPREYVICRFESGVLRCPE